MTDDSADELLESVLRLKLTSKDHLETLRDQLLREGTFSSKRVSDRLVAESILTEFQARQLLAGKGDECVLGDRYRLIDVLGEGAMGAVFLAHDTMLRRFPGFLTMSFMSIRCRTDMMYIDSGGSLTNPKGAGDSTKLYSRWRFRNNWRETARPAASSPVGMYWLPPAKDDKIQPVIDVLSRNPADANFLRPPSDSPLGAAGAGAGDASLPWYVGATPPLGAKTWDWGKLRERPD